MKKISETIWIIEAKETNDGTGDLIIDIPPVLLQDLGWNEGTLLNMEIIDGKIRLKKQK